MSIPHWLEYCQHVDKPVLIIIVFIERVINWRQTGCFSFWKSDEDGSSLVLSISTTLWRDWLCWKDFYFASARTIVDIASLTCLRSLCFSKSYCFVDVSKTSIKNERLGKASRMSFAGRHQWVTRLESGSKCRKQIVLVLTMVFVTDRGSSSFCLATRTMSECSMFDLWSSLVSKWVFPFAFCVY